MSSLSYETGLKRLLERPGHDHPRYAEALVLQERLLDNLHREQLFGGSESERSERIRIVYDLTTLALDTLGIIFFDLCSDTTPRFANGRAGSDSAVAVMVSCEPDSPDRRIEQHQRALRAARAAGDRRREGATLGDLGLAYVDSGETQRAIGSYRQQLAIMRELGDRLGEATALSNLGNVYADLGDGHRAIGHYEQVFAIARGIGDRRAEGNALSNLGLAYTALDGLSNAIKHYEKASIIAHELGDRGAEAIRRQNLGQALLRLADAEPDQGQSHLSRAAESLRQAVELFDALNAPQLRRARARYHLGRSYHRLGRWREAIELLEQARETFSRRKARPELAHTLLELGQLYHQYQDFESAYLYLKDALRLFRRLEDADGIAVTQEALGNLALQTARPAEAIASLQEARQSYVALKRRERIRAVDELLRLAHQSHQVATRKGVTP